MVFIVIRSRSFNDEMQILIITQVYIQNNTYDTRIQIVLKTLDVWTIYMYFLKLDMWTSCILKFETGYMDKLYLETGVWTSEVLKFETGCMDRWHFENWMYG